MPLNTGSHYSLAFNVNAMGRWARKAVDVLHTEIKSERVPLFIYQGFSGIAHGQAVARVWHRKHGAGYGQMYVRKYEENSHGADVEFCLPARDSRLVEPYALVFVDDFVDSGATRKRVVHEVAEWWHGNMPDSEIMPTDVYTLARPPGYPSDPPTLRKDGLKDILTDALGGD